VVMSALVIQKGGQNGAALASPGPAATAGSPAAPGEAGSPGDRQAAA
jgi:hypothetical protein